jgi:N-acetylglucosamine-6-sulfatase
LKVLNSLLMAVLVFAGAANAQTAKPNIVVVMLDDARLDDLAVMTKTNRIFSTGTAFANFYVSLAGCCPSRATYLTGQYPHNHGVWANNPPNGGYQVFRKTNTLPLWLQRAGYYTGLIGKFLNGYPLASNQREIPPGWNNFQGWFTGGGCMDTSSMTTGLSEPVVLDQPTIRPM